MGSFLQTLDNFFNSGTGFLFGPVMLAIFFGTGILMTIVTSNLVISQEPIEKGILRKGHTEQAYATVVSAKAEDIAMDYLLFSGE